MRRSETPLQCLVLPQWQAGSADLGGAANAFAIALF